jgi:beta-galactosidase
MKKRLGLLLVMLGGVAVAAGQASQSSRHTFGIQGSSFVYDGKPIQIRSGEMHYPRIPREYWRDRLKMARAMGLNTISTYVFWNAHEPRPGQFDFTGNLDVATFIKTAQEEGLHVILRPGPYVCAEWDLGGFPSWLLADRSIVLRSTDAKFLAASARYMSRVGRQLSGLQVGRGGPIIAVQVENEYGSFDSDKVYMAAIRDQIKAAGFTDALLYTADGPPQLPAGTLPDLPAVVNFGPGNVEKNFAALKEFRPNAPVMTGEYWAGWFDQWGGRHASTNNKQQTDELAWMLKQGHSFNLYMFHGGTTFGFMNGANWDRGYKPQVSSYDYDSVLDEAGRPKPRYAMFREAILKEHPTLALPNVPAPPVSIEIPSITLTQSASLFGELGNAVKSEKPKPMEDLGQSYGYILYRTRFPAAATGELVITELRDYGVIFINGKRVAALDRRNTENKTLVDVPAGGTLEILVENTGRINFRKELRQERKGITESVTLAGREVTGWEIFSLPMTSVGRSRFSAKPVSGPAFHRGTFNLSAAGDTFLDLRAWTKGAVWVNGHALGRFWNIGPQQTVYVPGPWLKRGANEIIVFDLADAPAARSIAGLKDPILNETKR